MSEHQERQAAGTRAKIDSGKEILNLEEAARFLGVSVKTFNKVLHTHNLPARKIGREWKFSRQALVAWVGAGRSDQYYREGSQPRRAAKAQATQAAQAVNADGGGNGPRATPDEALNGVELTPQAPLAGAPHEADARSATTRRTSGWRLELD